MANPIAEAFVRLRADTRGFRQETETGVKSSLGGLAKLAGVAFGAVEGIRFGKEIIGHAADLQKQVEAVQLEFGSASKTVQDFAGTSAASLGISEHAADAAAAKFGILFQNLGIGHEQAATMTVGFEQLAGTLSKIRNLDPSVALQNLPLAVAGNLRSLKQLGIATDQTQLKIAAYNLGLTKSVTQALTPAIRAQAIYAIATSHLGEFQQQAAKHSGDLANKQRILTAEWDNAKDSLGSGLMPVMTQVTTYLADNLPGAIKDIKGGFREIADDINSITGPIGGAKGAIVGFLAALSIAKLVAFANAIRVNIISNGAQLMAREFQVSEAEVVGAFSGMELAAIGFGATVKAALISTGIGAIFVGLGIAAELIITHWSTTKRWFADFLGWLKSLFFATKEAIIQSMKAAAYGMVEPYAWAIEQILSLASHIPGGIGKHAREAKAQVKALMATLTPDWAKVGAAWKSHGAKDGTDYGAAFIKNAKKELAKLESLNLTGPTGTPQYPDGLAGPASPSIPDPKAGKAAKDAIKQLADFHDALKGIDAKIKALGDGGVGKVREDLASLNSQLADAMTQETRDIHDIVEQAKENLFSLGSSIADTIGQVLDKPLADAQAKINAFTDQRSLEHLRREIYLPGGKELSEDPKKAIAELENLRAHTSAANKGSIDDFILQYKSAALSVQGDKNSAIKDRAKQRLADLVEGFDSGKLSYKQFKKGVMSELARDGVTYKKAGAELGIAFESGFRQQVTGILDQAQLIKGAPNVKGTTGQNANLVRPLDTIHQDNKEVARLTKEIGDKHTELQKKIASHASKIEALHRAGNDLLTKIHSVQLGPSADALRKNPGKARDAAATLNGASG